MERIKLLIAVLLLTCGLSGILTAASEAMVFPGEDWRQARPESQGIDSAKLKAAVSYLENNSGSDGVKELVIIRNGYNNNDMFVIGEWNMVIVRLGLDQRDLAIADAIYNTFLEKVGGAITR